MKVEWDYSISSACPLRPPKITSAEKSLYINNIRDGQADSGQSFLIVHRLIVAHDKLYRGLRFMFFRMSHQGQEIKMEVHAFLQ